MPRTILIDNEYVTLGYDSDKRFIYHTIHKPIDDEMFTDVLNAGTEALVKYKVCKWLSDDRKNGPISDEFGEWGRNDWGPRTISVGWKYWAMIVPEEFVAAGSLIPAIEFYYELGLCMMVFSNQEKAIKWLDRQKE